MPLCRGNRLARVPGSNATSMRPVDCPRIVPKVALPPDLSRKSSSRKPLTYGYLRLARATGIEPATTGSTIRYSNQLSYAPQKNRVVLLQIATTISHLPTRGGDDVPLPPCFSIKELNYTTTEAPCKGPALPVSRPSRAAALNAPAEASQFPPLRGHS